MEISKWSMFKRELKPPSSCHFQCLSKRQSHSGLCSEKQGITFDTPPTLCLTDILQLIHYFCLRTAATGLSPHGSRLGPPRSVMMWPCPLHPENCLWPKPWGTAPPSFTPRCHSPSAHLHRPWQLPDSVPHVLAKLVRAGLCSLLFPVLTTSSAFLPLPQTQPGWS